MMKELVNAWVQPVARLVLGVLLGVALAIPARAQFPDRVPPPGSRIPAKIPTLEIERDEARFLQARFGECVVKKHPEQARTFVLRYAYGDRGQESDSRKIIRTLPDGPCLIAATGNPYSGAMLRLPGDTLAYLLAEVLFRSELAGLPPLTALERIPSLEHPVLNASDYAPPRRARKRELEELAKQRAEARGRIYLSRFGECIVRADPSGSFSLLKSPVASPVEDAAFTALAGSLQSCLLDEHTVAFTKTVLRGAIAYNYYRLAWAPAAAPTPPEK